MPAIWAKSGQPAARCVIGLQINTGNGLHDPKLYSIHRDLAHCTGDLVRQTLRRFQDGVWPELQTLCQIHGVSQDDFGRAAEIFAAALGDMSDRREKLHETLAKHGWFNLPPIAQIAVMAMFGVTVFGASYASIREATLNRVGPALLTTDLAKRGAAAHRAMATGNRNKLIIPTAPT